jgi:ABC-type nitrate/sulfonate/bicarbonate transport system substrate-binding protein
VLVRFGEYDSIPTCLVVSAPFLEKHPDTVITFLRSWLDGVEFWQRNPGAVVESLHGMYRESGYTTLTPAIVGKMTRLPKVVPDITPELVASMKVQAEILQKAGSLKTLPDWDKVIRTDLLARARA